jgi:hypothetical protein
MCAQKQDVAMLELAKQLKDSNSLMFFARGNNYATALEAALKVRAVAAAGRPACVCATASQPADCALLTAGSHRGCV